ncbi:hypothetical protein [Arthrobacter sp. K5]|uniref:DUF5134 domain-containing protein n=1 Tax=Arthrobacter sp. K5 TaxID=2839623 RepID=A0AAU8EMA7_9MICC
MVEALHLGTVGLAAVGASCAAAAKGRGKVLAVTSSVVMLIAMIEAVAGFNLLPALGWSLAMLTVAMASGVQHHLMRNVTSTPECGDMAVHRNIGAILMAALLICMEAVHTSLPHTGHSTHGSTNPLGILLGAGAAAYAFASLWQACRAQTRRPLDRIESAAMGLSVLIMAVIAF